MYAVISIFTFFELACRLIKEGSLRLDGRWMIIFTAGTLAYIVIRFLVHYTSMLKTPDR